jgi:hypothetical protein
MDTLMSKSESIWSVLTKYLKAREDGDGVEYCNRGFEGRDLADFLDGWQRLQLVTPEELGKTDSQGLKGASIGLMKLPKDFVLDKLPKCGI